MPARRRASMNIQGEAQKKLDVIANDDAARGQRLGRPPRRPGVGGDGAQRSRSPTPIRAATTCCCSIRSTARSNIDVNISVGTIFSVLRCPDGVTDAGRRALPAAGHRAGRRRLLHLRPEHDAGAHRRPRHARVHPRPRSRQLRADHARHARSRRRPRNSRSTCPTSATGKRRCSATSATCWPARKARAARTSTCAGSPSMVADVHRILTRGGIFSYPLDAQVPRQGRQAAPDVRSQPDGFLVEQAGGAASTGRQRMLDVQPHRPAPARAGVPRQQARGRERPCATTPSTTRAQ